MMQDLIFRILFLKILFRAHKVFICVHTFQWTPSEFFFVFFFQFSDFQAESLKANKNQRKISLILQCSFAQKTSLILGISTHLTLKTICSRNTVKNLSEVTNFPANMFLFGVKKKKKKSFCAAPFLDAQELHS